METPSLLRGARGLFAPSTLARAIADLDELRCLIAPVRCPSRKNRALRSLAEAAAALERRFLGPGEPTPAEGLSAGLLAEIAATRAPRRADRKEPRPPRISKRRARIAAWFEGLDAAVRAGRPAELDALLAAAPGAHAAARGHLRIAMELAARGQRTEARRRLSRLSEPHLGDAKAPVRSRLSDLHIGDAKAPVRARLSDPLLAHAAALLRARLDLDGGLVERAGRRVDALPGGLHLPSRARRAVGPRLPGEPEALALACAREAMILRWRLGRIDPASRAARDAVTAWIDDPAACLAMFPSWDGERGPAQIIAEAPKRLRAKLHDDYRSAFACAHAGAVAARVARLTGTLADLRAAPHVDAGLALALGALGSPAACEAELRRPDFADAASPARAFFDEGLSLTPRRERKRTALVEAARASLSKLLTTNCAQPFAAEVAAARARILLRLPGDRAAAALLSALRSGSPHRPDPETSSPLRA